ncbi:MAG: transketolase [Spirochaetaceae bacterium]|nr:transketolase [Spirochaetaceae bacterium]
MASIDTLSGISIDIRKKIVQMVFAAKGGHIGGSLSSADILTSLFFHVMTYDAAKPQDPNRDRFILSKGHSVEGYYSALALAGFFPVSRLEEYGSFGTMLFGHPTLKVPGVEIPSGSLGHGLAVGVGMALAAKRDGKGTRVFVLMGDGEQAEGSIWEAAMAASNYRLDNLVAVIDNNNLQISGPVDSVMRSAPLAEKYESFGWSVRKIDGHDFSELNAAFDEAPWEPGQPSLVIARTIKGRGASFMENNAAWHHKTPTQEEFEYAINELDRAAEEM